MTDRGDLSERWPHPFLVQITAGGGGHSLDETTTEVRVKGTATSSGSPIALHELRKRPGSNPFVGMVTLGRAGNNDIVLAEPTISACHVCFVERRPGEWTITDSSRNGTWVDGLRLAPGKAQELKVGAQVRLASSIVMAFVTAYDIGHLLSEDFDPQAFREAPAGMNDLIGSPSGGVNPVL
jgi:hypothetical protein